MRRDRKPAKAKLGAKLPGARTSRKNEGSRGGELEKRLAEALKREAEALEQQNATAELLQTRNRELTELQEQQTATAEILQVISSSPTGVQPVFEVIARSATTLCEADLSGLFTFDGELIHLEAQHGRTPEEIDAVRRAFPQPPGRGSVTARAVLAAAAVQVPDHSKDPEVADALRMYRTVIAVPMLHEGRPIGTITLARRAVRPFSDKQIELLQTFADQGVIAIENVRLFNETKKALEQQTATADILRVIAGSPTDVQPVFDTIAASALALCRATSSLVTRFDGERLHLVAMHNLDPQGSEAHRRRYPMPVSRGAAAARAMVSRNVEYVPDVSEDPEYGHRDVAQTAGYRSVLAVPMLRDGVPIGAITVFGAEVGMFSDRQVTLLQTFADQAVIAIENVRLFNETKEALEQQTATSEILRVISSSPTDLQPVFDAIAERAMHLCGASSGGVWRFDGEPVHIAALANVSPDGIAATRNVYPMSPSSRAAGARAILTGGLVHIPDVWEDPEYGIANEAQVSGFRSIVSVPMLHEGESIGAVTVGRPDPGPFSERQISVLKTFADQAVIAIENVRLFHELQERTRELARSVAELRALGEVGQAVSSTLDVETVLQTIVSRAQQLAGTEGCTIFEYDEATEEFHLRATQNYDVELVEAARAMPLRRGEGVIGLAAERREPIQVADITEEGTIAVSDTGIGIAPEDQAAIFEEFRQVGRDDARKQEGTGLGLTLSKKFVELHRGRIWVQSQVGQGSTFTFTLPVRPEGTSPSYQGGGAPPLQ